MIVDGRWCGRAGREPVRDHRYVALGALIIALGLSVLLAVPALAEPEADPLYDDFFDEEFDAPPIEYPDPIESTNRGTFAFNRQLDKWVLDPVTRGYRYVVPKPVRLALSRVFVNLGSTKTMVNDFLQLEWEDAAVTTTRLVLNTTIGIGGLFDVAAKMGLEGHESDFGQTLALAGVPSGPYLMGRRRSCSTPAVRGSAHVISTSSR